MACAGRAWMARGGRSAGDGDGLGISGRSPSPLPSPAGRGDWFGRWSAIGRKLLCPDAAFMAPSPSGKGGRDRICGTARRARHWNVELRGLVPGGVGGAPGTAATCLWGAGGGRVLGGGVGQGAAVVCGRVWWKEDGWTRFPAGRRKRHAGGMYSFVAGYLRGRRWVRSTPGERLRLWPRLGRDGGCWGAGRGEVRRTGSMVWGRGLGTRMMGQPS